MPFRNIEEQKREFEGITYYERPEIEAQGKTYRRLAVQTHFIEPGESYIENLRRYVLPLWQEGDILSMSEKVISVCQNNMVDIKDIKVGFWAKVLTRFASTSAAGPGFKIAPKMQLCINLIGLPRMLFAAVCSAVGKLFGKKGVFYKIIGQDLTGIDGFYDDATLELYKTKAILNPINPSGVCDEIGAELGMTAFIGDVCDVSQVVLGRPSSGVVSDELYLAVIRDNPAGQSDELTPFILVREKTEG